MRYNLFFLILILFISVSALCGEKEKIYLTGNRTVDFFGSPMSKPELSMKEQPLLYLQESEPNIDQEKSPWLAGLFSLAVPGAGEYYSKSYVKAGIFFGVEVGSWITTLVYNKKGDRQTTLFKNYANVHYSPVRYAQWVLNNASSLNDTLHASNYHVFNYAPSDNCQPPYPCLNWGELNRLESQIPEFTHKLEYFGDQQYYELIGKYRQFSKGWDSEDPNESDYLTPNKQYYDYFKMFNQADKYYKVGDAFASVIIVNHILSALDAIWTTTRYNKSLHASVRMEMYKTPYGYLPGARADFQYSF
jgi:hypothetical protein